MKAGVAGVPAAMSSLKKGVLGVSNWCKGLFLTSFDFYWLFYFIFPFEFVDASP